jgi:hypothetical protein
MKIKNVEITKPELDALEDLAVVWILCKKHNAQMDWKDEVKVYKIQQSCKACRKEVKTASNRALHLWSKLVHAYEIARKGYCDCERKSKRIMMKKSRAKK